MTIGLINNTKSKFKVKGGYFPVGKTMDFEDDEARTLLKYKGINRTSDLAANKAAATKAEAKAAIKASALAEAEVQAKQ